MSPVLIIVAVIAGVLSGALAAFLLARRTASTVVLEAEARARTLSEAAAREAEALRKEAIVNGKESLRQERDKLAEESKAAQQEIRNAQQDLKQQQKKIEQREEDLDRQRARLEKREEEVDLTHAAARAAQAEAEQARSDWQTRVSELDRQLEQVAGLSLDEARAEVVRRAEETARIDAAKAMRRVEEEAKEQAETNAKHIVAQAIQRYSGDYVVERTVTVVPIPDDGMKGRIIGREGRNIRAFEMITGVDLIVDDTPESVVISCHNPLRRQIARQTLERLIEDGRIQPGRIEELHQAVTADIEKEIGAAGQHAVFDLGLQALHPELVRLMGINKFRTSYAQNILHHSSEVGFLCGMMADELGLDRALARRCGFLHDIGKAVDQEFEGSHAQIGADLCRKYGESDAVVRAVAEHHDDSPSTIYGILVQAADALSAARPGARREMLASYVKRLEELEDIARRHTSVQRAYAIQAGRELRVVLDAEQTSDDGAFMLAREIAAEIEAEMTYPGQIKVTVLRETRATAFAK